MAFRRGTQDLVDAGHRHPVTPGGPVSDAG
jgi:hypothetical protein